MSISGTGSGGTLDTYIQQILNVERQPARQLEALRATITQKRGVFTDISSRLTALRSALAGLKDTGSLSAFRAFSVESSKADVLGATATSDAVAGTHTLQITNLARPHSLASTGFVGATTGAFAAGTSAFQITVAGDTKTVSVSLDGTETNSQALLKIVNAVNQSGAGVSATVVTSDAATGTQKLVLTSKKTGTTNLVSSVADTTGGLAAQLGLAGASTTAAYSAATSQTALDASFTLDGLALSSSTNTVATAIRGVTLDLKGTSPATDITLKIVPDTAKGKEKVTDFITKFNDAIDLIRGKTATAESFGDRAILAGSTSFMQLLNDMRRASSLGVSGLATGSLASLAEIGITFDRAGKMTLADAEKLSTALSEKQSQVEDLFGAADGVGKRLNSLMDNFLGLSGVLVQEQTLLNGQDKQLKTRIARIDSQLAQREKVLRTQFSQLLQLQARLQAQQGSASLTGF